MRLRIVFTIFSLSYCVHSGTINSSRNEKVFPFLAVVSFPNLECSAPNSNGICYSKKQCKDLDGVELGTSCAQNYGVCCSFTKSCPMSGGQVTVKNNLTFIGGTSPQACNFIFPKQKDVCQLRLDFEIFTLNGTKYPQNPIVPPPPPPPTGEELYNAGNCMDENLSVSKTQNLPDGLTICGPNTGQHLYLQYGDQDKITLSLNQFLGGSNTKIKVTQIKCDSPLKAPQGCTQYFREKSKQVQSFNYPFAQLNSQFYTVCVDNSDGNKQIQWSACPVSTGMYGTSFFVSKKAYGSPYGLQGSADCRTDYVIIPNSGSDRYCGGEFVGTQSSSQPFEMIVNFDKSEAPAELLTENQVIDPETGCPIGTVCSDAPNKCIPGGPGGCIVPQVIYDMVDEYNIGFCMMYTVK